MIDKNSNSYRELKAELESRIALHRKALEAITCPPEKTSELRGRISEIKHFLDYNGEQTE